MITYLLTSSSSSKHFYNLKSQENIRSNHILTCTLPSLLKHKQIAPVGISQLCDQHKN